MMADMMLSDGLAWNADCEPHSLTAGPLSAPVSAWGVAEPLLTKGATNPNETFGPAHDGTTHYHVESGDVFRAIDAGGLLFHEDMSSDDWGSAEPLLASDAAGSDGVGTLAVGLRTDILGYQRSDKKLEGGTDPVVEHASMSRLGELGSFTAPVPLHEDVSGGENLFDHAGMRVELHLTTEALEIEQHIDARFSVDMGISGHGPNATNRSSLNVSRLDSGARMKETSQASSQMASSVGKIEDNSIDLGTNNYSYDQPGTAGLGPAEGDPSLVPGRRTRKKSKRTYALSEDVEFMDSGNGEISLVEDARDVDYQPDEVEAMSDDDVKGRARQLHGKKTPTSAQASLDKRKAVEVAPKSPASKTLERSNSQTQRRSRKCSVQQDAIAKEPDFEGGLSPSANLTRKQQWLGRKPSEEQADQEEVVAGNASTSRRRSSRSSNQLSLSNGPVGGSSTESNGKKDCERTSTEVERLKANESDLPSISNGHAQHSGPRSSQRLRQRSATSSIYSNSDFVTYGDDEYDEDAGDDNEWIEGKERSSPEFKCTHDASQQPSLTTSSNIVKFKSPSMTSSPESLKKASIKASRKRRRNATAINYSHDAWAGTMSPAVSSRSRKRSVPLAAQRIRATSARHEMKGRPSFAEIVETGFMQPGIHRFHVGNVEVSASVGDDGAITYEGIRYRAISKFALVVLRERNPARQSCDGWKEVALNGEKLDVLRLRVQQAQRKNAIHLQ